jgi:hypothetical protein
MNTGPSGLVSLSWPTRGGYGYRVETSSDLESDAWQPLASFYGNGGTLSIPVAQITPPGAQPPPVAPPVNVRSAHFTLRAFPGLNKTLVAWNQPGQTGLSQVLLNATDFSTIVDLPLFFGKFADPANGIDYLLSFVILGGDFDPAYDLLTPALLSPEETERLAWFTDRMAEVKAAMEAAQANGQATNNVPATNAGSGGPGVQVFFRLVELYQDSDGDGILDHHERDVTGTDPWDADSDNDGFSDGAEFEAGSDPHNANSTPANDAGGPPGTDLPPDGDEDGDTIPNALDADPLDLHVDWERRPFPDFVVLPIPDSSGKTLAAVNNKGEVVMNASGSPGAYFWNPSLTAPEALSTEGLTFTLPLYSGMEEGEPVLKSYTFTLDHALAHDLNNAGVIVGEGYFTSVLDPPAASGGTTTTSTPIAGPTMTVAIQWENWETPPAPAPPRPARPNPTLVHPGAVIQQGAEEWGSIPLTSRAFEINEAGTIRGEADYAVPAEDPEKKPPFDLARVPTLWTVVRIGGEGLPLYEPEEPVPSPPPIITSMASDQSHFTGSSDGAALWNEWTETPAEAFPEAGSRSVRISLVPNGRQAVAGERRLMLYSKQGRWEPGLRTYSQGFDLTEDGTVWVTDLGEESLWHPVEKVTVTSITGLHGYEISQVNDITNLGVTGGESNHGNVLLLPVEFEITNWEPVITQPLAPYTTPWEGRDPAENLLTDMAFVGVQDDQLEVETFEIDADVQIKLPQINSVVYAEVASEWQVAILQDIYLLPTEDHQTYAGPGGAGSRITTFNNIPGMDALSFPPTSEWPDPDYPNPFDQFEDPQRFVTGNETLHVHYSDSPSTGAKLYEHEYATGDVTLTNLKRDVLFVTWVYAEHVPTKTRRFLKWVRWQATWNVDVDAANFYPPMLQVETYSFRVVDEGSWEGPISPPSFKKAKRITTFVPVP